MSRGLEVKIPGFLGLLSQGEPWRACQGMSSEGEWAAGSVTRSAASRIASERFELQPHGGLNPPLMCWLESSLGPACPLSPVPRPGGMLPLQRTGEHVLRLLAVLFLSPGGVWPPVCLMAQWQVSGSPPRGPSERSPVCPVLTGLSQCPRQGCLLLVLVTYF